MRCAAATLSAGSGNDEALYDLFDSQGRSGVSTRESEAEGVGRAGGPPDSQESLGRGDGSCNGTCWHIGVPNTRERVLSVWLTGLDGCTDDDDGDGAGDEAAAQKLRRRLADGTYLPPPTPPQSPPQSQAPQTPPQTPPQPQAQLDAEYVVAATLVDKFTAE